MIHSISLVYSGFVWLYALSVFSFGAIPAFQKANVRVDWRDSDIQALSV